MCSETTTDPLSMKLRWTCPHCGLEQFSWADFNHRTHSVREFTYCDIEQGGCEKPVALKSHLSVQTTAYLIIE